MGIVLRLRINENTIALYISSDNINYTLIPEANWEYQKDEKGIITLTLKERLATRYLKLHIKYDERGWDFKPVNKATFLNEVAQMLRVYQEADSRTEEYQYDLAGNRKLLRVTLARTLDYNSQYYTNTDRLKTDGKYAFVYDEAGNMVKKGNTFTISGDTVIFTETSGEGVEYWEYEYDLLNRLVEVKKNGSTVAEYGYDPEGFRVVAKKYLNDTTLKEKRHYIFQGTEPIFEKNITTGKMKSFVYALGKHLARVDGAIGHPDAKKYWYVTDHLGSIRTVTDKKGKKVWSADYLAFGTQYGKDADTDFEELHSFTGKEFDPDTGLHYYNARWYDSELGRFVSEDPAGDPNNPNLYVYGRNNPLGFIDPTGCISQEEGMALHAANSTGGGNGNGSGNPGSGGSSGPSTPETPEPGKGPSTSNGPPKVKVNLDPDGYIESVVIEGDTDGYDISIETETFTPIFIPRDRETGLPGEPIRGETITISKVTITRNNKRSDFNGDGNDAGDSSVPPPPAEPNIQNDFSFGDIVGTIASLASTSKTWSVSESTGTWTESSKFVRNFRGVEGIKDGTYGILGTGGKKAAELGKQIWKSARPGIWGVALLGGLVDAGIDGYYNGFGWRSVYIGAKGMINTLIAGHLGTLTTTALICSTVTPAGWAVAAGVGVSILATWGLNQVEAAIESHYMR